MVIPFKSEITGREIRYTDTFQLTVMTLSYTNNVDKVPSESALSGMYKKFIGFATMQGRRIQGDHCRSVRPS